MANIQPEIDAFQNAVYGEDVRSAMVSLANKINTETSAATSLVNSHNAEFDQLMENAETALENATDAADNADDARELLEANEAARITAETARAAAETARANAETLRNTSEIERVNAETTRASAETGRVNSETDRRTAEVTRNASETVRSNAESERIQNERTRTTNELNRQSSESTRDAQETYRVNQENLRQAQESTRQANELARIQQMNQIIQQTVPAATTTSAGVVIVGAGLEVDANGKISVTGAGDLETGTHAAATYLPQATYTSFLSVALTVNDITKIGPGLTLDSGKIRIDPQVTWNEIAAVLSQDSSE